MQFNIDPYNLIRLVIRQIYENNINQFKEDDSFPIYLKFAVCDFILKDHSSEWIDNLFKDEEAVKITADDTFKRKLWNSIIESKEFNEHLDNYHCLDSSVYDKVTKREYECEFGEHYFGLLTALEDANVPMGSQDEYVTENITIRGRNNKVDIDLSEYCLGNERLKPVDKVTIVKNYTNEWLNNGSLVKNNIKKITGN